MLCVRHGGGAETALIYVTRAIIKIVIFFNNYFFSQFFFANSFLVLEGED